MRIAYFGYDFFVACFARLIAAGHEIISAHTFHTDNTWDFNSKILDHAKRIDCPVSFDAPNEETIQALVRNRCDLIVTAGYPYKIPVFNRDGLALGMRGINIHPTLLPQGRGRWPLPWLILKYPECAGITVHKLTPSWDTGDILAQRQVQIDHCDDLETLSMKLQICAPQIVAEVLDTIEVSWSQAAPQGDRASYWPMPTAADRRLNWCSTVDELLRIVRAFSKFESSALIHGKVYTITRANGWVAHHTEPVGTVVHESNRELVVAVSDGYLVLQEFRIQA